MRPALAIFSGLPGTGKSTLATPLALTLKIPIIRLDDVTGDVPRGAGIDYWDAVVDVTLDLAEAQLELGMSVVIDAVFMAYDRYHAQELARKHHADFRPVHTFVSDEPLWEKRVTRRYAELNNEAVSTWEGIVQQRKRFLPWQPGTALFVDAVNPVERNYARVIEFVTSREIVLEPLRVNVPLVKGHYHE
jgi:predicted kinase